MTTTKPFQLGSISTGTLRPEDLLPVFFRKLWQLEEAIYYKEHNTKMFFIHSPVLTEAIQMHQTKNWSRAEMDAVLYRVRHGINHLCPPFVYFGAHPGDGSDFGFWINYEELQEAIAHAQHGWELLGFPPIGPAPNERIIPDRNVSIFIQDENCTCVSNNKTKDVIWSTA